MGAAARRRRRQQQQRKRNQLMMRAASDPSFFYYNGNAMGLQARLNEVYSKGAMFTQAHITVMGNQVKQSNICCMVLMVILSMFLIFPFICLCMDCFKKFVYPGYQVPLSTYQLLQVLLNNPQMRSMTLVVVDNPFDQTKTKTLYDILSKSGGVRGFDFKNNATPHNYNDREWSDFTQNMKPIKILSIQSNISWYDQIVL